MEQSYLSFLRESIVEQYRKNPEKMRDKDYTSADCGGSFGELLCGEIHINKLTFIKLAEKWDITLPTLGELIKDHCDRLQEMPKVKFNK